MRNLPKRKTVKTESPIEDIVLREFHLLGFYPIPQFKIGMYRIDLAFPDRLLAIECDGKKWHSSKEQKERDEKRDNYLRKQGWKVIRISGSDIYRKADEIIGLMVGTKRKRLDKFKKPIFLETKIDYENDSLDIIQEKEEDLRIQREFLLEETRNKSVGKFSSIKEIIKERYKFGVN